MAGGIKNAFEVKWRIENITSCLQTRDDTLYSPQFLAEAVMNTGWKLNLTKNGRLAEKYLTLTLLRAVEDDGPEWIPLNYELSFLACDGSLIKSKSYHKKFASETVSQELNVKLVDVLNDKKEVNFPEGVLTVRCKLWKAWSAVTKGGLCSIRSVIGTKSITLEAVIHNYSSLILGSKMTVIFMSPSTEIDLISFDVHLTRNMYDRSFCDFKRIEVYCGRFKRYSCQLFALKNDGTETQIKKYLDTLLSSNKECAFEFEHLHYDTAEYLKNGALTLQIVVKYFPGVESECIEYDDIKDEKTICKSADVWNISNPEGIRSNPSDRLHLTGHENKPRDSEQNGSSDEGECFNASGKSRLPSTTFKEDMSSLCNDRLFCDTKLQTDTETFSAHRSVLSARSPVFKKLFTTDLKEKAGECIHIPDISSDTVSRMLQFIYTDCTGELEMQSAKDLYIAADKYDIASLKQRCSSFMKKNLCPSNVCEVLLLADMHQDKNLESAAQEFVLTYDKEVFGADEWKLFMKNFSGLAAKVMYLKCMKE